MKNYTNSYFLTSYYNGSFKIYTGSSMEGYSKYSLANLKKNFYIYSMSIQELYINYLNYAKG